MSASGDHVADMAAHTEMRSNQLSYLKTKLLTENKNNVNTNEATLKNMKALVSTLTMDDFGSGGLADTMVTTMKTSTEQSATVILFILSNIPSSVDISSVVAETNATLYKLLRSSNAESRVKGLQIFDCISRIICCGPNYTIDFFSTHIIAVLFDCLNGKNGIIANNMQRLSFLKALCNCSKHPLARRVGLDEGTYVVFLTAAVKSLAVLCEKDSDANNRLLIAQTLAGFVRMHATACAGGELATEVTDTLTGYFLSSKNKNVVSAGIIAVSTLFATSGDECQSAICKSLLGAKAYFFAALASYNAKGGVDALLALRILLVLAKTSAEVLAELRASQALSEDAKDNVFCTLLTRTLLAQMFEVPAAASAEGGGDFTAIEERGIANINGYFYNFTLSEAVLAALGAAASLGLSPPRPRASPSGALSVEEKYPFFAYANGSLAGFVTTIMACRDYDLGVSRGLLDSLFVKLCSANAAFAMEVTSVFERCSYRVAAVAETIVAVDGDKETSSSPSAHRAIPCSKLNRITCLLFEVFNSLTSSSSSSSNKYDGMLASVLLLCSGCGNSRKRSAQVFRKGAGGAKNIFSQSSVEHAVGRIADSMAAEMKSTPRSECTLTSLVYATEILLTSCGRAERASVKNLLFNRHLFGIINGNVEAVLSFKDSEIEAYLRPVEILSALRNRPIVVTDEELKITNADRKKDVARSSRKGTFGSDFAEDEEWIEGVKREKTKAIVERKQADLAEEVRAREREIKEVTERVNNSLLSTLYVVDSFALFLDVDVIDHIVCYGAGSQRVFGNLAHLLRSHLSSDKVLRCLNRFAVRCGSGSGTNRIISQNLAYDVVNTIRIMVQSLNRPLKKGETFADVYKDINYFSGSISRLLKTLQLLLLRSSSSGSGATYLDASIVASCIYICRSVTSLHALLPGCDAVWVVVESLWSRVYLDPLTLIEGSAKSINSCAERVAVLRPLQADVIFIILNIMSKFANRVADSNTIEKTLSRIIVANKYLTESEWSLLLSESGFLNTDSNIRLTIIRATHSILIGNNNKVDDLVIAGDGAARTAMVSSIATRLFVLMSDETDEIRSRSKEMYQYIQSTNSEHAVTASYYIDLINLLSGAAKIGENIRVCIAKAIAKGLLVHASATAGLVAHLEALFIKLSAQIDYENSVFETKSSDKGSTIGAAKGKGDKAAPKRDIKYLPDAHVRTRVSVAMIVGCIGSEKALTDNSDIRDVLGGLLRFVLSYGVVDTSSEVRQAMLAAARALIDGYGDSISGIIFSIIESALSDRSSPSGGDEEDIVSQDRRHQSTVVLLGAVGKHLDKDDPKLISITNLMMESLSIPSESVQKAVAESLQSLIGVLKSSASVTAEGSDVMKRYLDALLDTSLNSSDYGAKRGAAYGISAVVKGLGVSCLKTFDIITRLKDACGSGSVNGKQGSLFVFELISERMGLLFEPYVITIIPLLLKCFSDSNDHVREASQLTAKVIMAKLSAHGIKQVLTPIVTSLPEEKQWKTRQEAIRLLGTMAYCAPKQLAACLPQVVPRVVDANINDPHPKVKETAKKVLGDISSVIKSPEISRLSPVLLTALCDPANKTKEALEALLDCEFMHSIDPASLALLVPILSRALRDRGADLKRKASAITGNMMSMVSDTKSLVPYLHQLLPGLKDCLVDPIPDVRATSAKALGSLIAIGEEEEGLGDVIPYLLLTMRSDSSSVERSGAAQGLSEVCYTLGDAKLAEVLQLLLASAASAAAGRAAAKDSTCAREGLLWLLSFLPPLFRGRYEPFIELTLPVILQGLRDEAEGVREVAMRSGQIYVSILGKSNTLLLLPSLSNGMFNEDWRIRHSSVILLGDLLYLIGDTKAVGVADNADDDDGDFGYSGGGAGGASRVAVTIRAHIGDAETDKVFSVLYVARCDVSSSVRQLSLQVWKSVISNSPRTLSQIMPSLVRIVVEKLSSTQEDMQMSAARALGELVKKMAEKTLPIIIPFMQKGIRSPDKTVRQGVCVGLAEILTSGSRKTIEDNVSVLVLSLQQALCDESEEVRGQSAAAFHTLFKTIGHKAIDSVIPVLLERITDVKDSSGDDGSSGDSSNDGSFFALLGLREVVMQQPRDLLEYILPKLLTAPMQPSSCKALGAVAMAAGHHMNHHYRSLVSLLVGELAATSDNADRLAAEGDETGAASERLRLAAVQDAAGAALGACSTQGLHYLVTELGRQIEHDSCSKSRRWGCFAVDACVRNSKADFAEYIPLVLKYLLSRCADSDTATLTALSSALSTISSCVPLDELIKHLDFLTNCISSTASSARHAVGSHSIVEERTGLDLLPLFTIPKSIEPFVVMYLHAMLHGSISQKEQAANSLGDLLNMCDETVLRPYLIKTTGPLIRIVGDRLPSEVKAAILNTLCVLLNKGSVGIKAFVPQLQTTFIKSLSDSSKVVRSRAIEAVGRLMPLVVRVDALLLELLTLSYQTDSTKIKGSLYEAISVVLSEGGDKASAVSFDKVRVGLMEFILDSSNAVNAEAAVEVKTSACNVIGALTCYLSEEEVGATFASLLEGTSAGEVVDVAGDNSGVVGARILALASALSTAGARAHGSREAAFRYFKATLSATYSGGGDIASIRISLCSALLLLVTTPKKISADTDKKAEFKQGAQLVINNFTKDLAKLTANCDNNLEIRRLILYYFKNAAKSYPKLTEKFISEMLPGVALGVKDLNLRIINVAQRALKYICSNNERLVMDFCSSTNNGDLRDYVKRVISRMGDAASDDEEGW